MFCKMRKIARLIEIKSMYPNVIYFGAPSFLKFFGIPYKALRNGFYSQYGQDELVFTEFFKSIASGNFPKLFIDIGCNHPLVHSNSYFFEVNQGYKVLAVDALQEVGELWGKHRQNAAFVNSAVGASDGEVSFDVFDGDDIDSMFSSVSGVSHHEVSNSFTTRTVKVRRISDILAERGIQSAGILSMDIEGYELQALQGIDFNKFLAYVFIIKNNSENGLGNNQIREIMINNGYIYFARIWNSDDIFIHPNLLSLSQSEDLG